MRIQCFIMVLLSTLIKEGFSKIVFKKYNPTFLEDAKYPVSGIESKYEIALVADLDEEGKDDSLGIQLVTSYLKTGAMIFNSLDNTVQFKFDGTKDNKGYKIFSKHMNDEGRGLELSEITTYFGNVFSFDDQTGIVYHIKNTELIPWVTAEDENHQGVNAEWAMVIDGSLYVGPNFFDEKMNVAKIDKSGKVTMINWSENFSSFNNQIGKKMGYESAEYNEADKLLYFLPVVVENKKKKINLNAIVTSTKDFKSMKKTNLEQNDDDKCFASFKFIPGTNYMVALQTSLNENKTYITVISTKGKIISKPLLVSDSVKYEGIELI